MEVYAPMPSGECLDLVIGDRRHRVESRNGWFALPRIDPCTTFTLVDKGKTLVASDELSLQQLEESLYLLEAYTCLHVHDMLPVFKTSVYYADDPQIAMICHLLGVKHNCPLTVSWTHNKQLWYGTLVTIPASTDAEGGFPRKYAHGVHLTPPLSAGRYEASVKLLSGKEVVRTAVTLLDRRRGTYGNPSLGNPYSNNLLKEA